MSSPCDVGAVDFRKDDRKFGTMPRSAAIVMFLAWPLQGHAGRRATDAPSSHLT
ncbi:hypothetical protein ABCW43_07640 [Neorhizobium sp. IRAMC:178]|uniref:hypothetical protein n=1 Tax=Neorhizobium tunisiense TaxID=3144793 RepID=UPI0031F60438